ncbi:DUF4342 domain-containing protein [Desulforamulus ferrireducens]|uniref:Ubiquitin n=1 Tax=Desulforamulus ferrireducens TaxID=1833852 RepID=A0A1S6ITL6_9FIRM|nr:DUF4342 domain-containing protein [Desulforamulus ferrireducens]AQS58114.1 ubiquitin [Desulforamulus ferrireducens]
MTFNLEQIDELKKRANVSYSEAKEALEQCHGDLLEALIYLETKNKIKPEQNTSCDMLSKIKSLVKKGNDTRFVITKQERTALDLSVNVSAVITAFAPYVVFPGLLLALCTGHKMKFEGKNGEDVKVNQALSKLSKAVTSAKKSLTEEPPNTVTQ